VGLELNNDWHTPVYSDYNREAYCISDGRQQLTDIYVYRWSEMNITRYVLASVSHYELNVILDLGLDRKAKIFGLALKSMALILS